MIVRNATFDKNSYENLVIFFHFKGSVHSRVDQLVGTAFLDGNILINYYTRVGQEILS